jgi:hypothetical protein
MTSFEGNRLSSSGTNSVNTNASTLLNFLKSLIRHFWEVRFCWQRLMLRVHRNPQHTFYSPYSTILETATKSRLKHRTTSFSFIQQFMRVVLHLRKINARLSNSECVRSKELFLRLWAGETPHENLTSFVFIYSWRTCNSFPLIE